MHLLSDRATRSLVLVGLWLCLVGGVACVWELLALQMPDSPFHVGVLSGPIAQLRNFSFGLGLGLLVLSMLWRSLYSEGEARWLLFTLIGAALLQAGALGYAAGQGMVGVQLLDPRLDARLVVYVRLLAYAALLVGLVTLLVRAARRSRG
jgi:hypothetical protein